jgi:hypothetical protein
VQQLVSIATEQSLSGADRGQQLLFALVFQNLTLLTAENRKGHWILRPNAFAYAPPPPSPSRLARSHR